MRTDTLRHRDDALFLWRGVGVTQTPCICI
jgi:hypothetical protein